MRTTTSVLFLFLSVISLSLVAAACSEDNRHVSPLPEEPAAQMVQTKGSQQQRLKTRPVVVECLPDADGERIATFVTNEDTLRVKRGQRMTFISLDVPGTFHAVADDSRNNQRAWRNDPAVGSFRADDTAYAEEMVTGRMNSVYTIEFHSADASCGDSISESKTAPDTGVRFRHASLGEGASSGEAPIRSSPKMHVE